jgi:hypothetical protein
MGLLRSLFGPSREEIWRQLSHETGGQYVEGGFWKADKVVARHGQWTITLDTYTVSHGKSRTTYTRLRAPYVNRDGFRFTIYRRGFFTDLGKLLGMQDVEIGDPLFDDAFVIKGNDEFKLRALFANPRLRDRLHAQPTVHLEVKDDEGWFGADFPDGVDELAFHTVGVITDVERLKALYGLFAETLNQLCVIGSAYENEPNVGL